MLIRAMIDGREAVCDAYGPVNRCPCASLDLVALWTVGHPSHWWRVTSWREAWLWCAGSDEFSRPWVEGAAR